MDTVIQEKDLPIHEEIAHIEGGDEVLESGAVIHNVHKIEGTSIIVHEETEEEIEARKHGDADKVTLKTWLVVVVSLPVVSHALLC